MTFATKLALFISLAVIAPIIAHLLQKRIVREKLFPATSLIPGTTPEAQKRRKFEDWPIFVPRALTILFLALLGATPFVHCSDVSLTRKSGASIALIVVVDDSMSMRARLTNGTTRFEKAISSATSLLSEMRSGDYVGIVMAGGPARVALAPSANVNTAISILKNLHVTDRNTQLDDAMQIAKGLLQSLAHADKRIVLFSDLTDGQTTPLQLDNTDAISRWAPLDELREKASSNCAIVHATRLGSRVRVRVGCSNADESKQSTIEIVSATNPSMQFGTLRIQNANHVSDVLIPLSSQSEKELVAKLVETDLIAEDNFAPVAESESSLHIATVVDKSDPEVETGGLPPVEQALRSLPGSIDLHPLASIPEHDEELRPYAMLVMDDPPGLSPEARKALRRWIARGAIAWITLGPRAATAQLGLNFDTLLSGNIRYESDAFEGIDASSTSILGETAESWVSIRAKGRTRLQIEPTSLANVLIRWNDQMPFLIENWIERGAVYFSTTSFHLDESDLVLRPAFLRVLEELLNQARSLGGTTRIDTGTTWSFRGYQHVSIEHITSGKASAHEPTTTEHGLVFSPEFIGKYRITLDGETVSRYASLPESEIDLNPRPLTFDNSHSENSAAENRTDTSPWIAVILLGLFASELFMRLWAQRREPSM